MNIEIHHYIIKHYAILQIQIQIQITLFYIALQILKKTLAQDYFVDGKQNYSIYKKMYMNILMHYNLYIDIWVLLQFSACMQNTSEHTM